MFSASINEFIHFKKCYVFKINIVKKVCIKRSMLVTYLEHMVRNNVIWLSKHWGFLKNNYT